MSRERGKRRECLLSSHQFSSHASSRSVSLLLGTASLLVGFASLLLDCASKKANDSAIRGSISLSQLRDSQADEHTIKQREIFLDKELLQLVQGACKADNLQRALDLTRLMHNPGSVDAAAKIAGFYHLPGLQERMGGVVVKKKKVEYHPTRYGNGNGNGSGSGEREKTKGFNDFAPRNTRRSFGGKVRDRDSTPANGGNGTYIPETPRTELESTPLEESVMGSPEGKRKRDEEEFEPVRKVESSFKGMSFSPRLAFLLLEYSRFHSIQE
jgi:chromosome transmission fidelity protein 4